MLFRSRFELRRVDFAFLDFGHFLDFLDLRTSEIFVLNPGSTSFNI